MADDIDYLLRGRLEVLRLDADAIGRDFPEIFSGIKRKCPLCGDRKACVLDLQNDPNTCVWDAYCPNAEVLHTLVALAELNT